MSIGYTDLYVAKQKMKFKSRNIYSSFVTTLWRGEVIICCFNNLSKEVSQIYCSQVMDSSDINQLETMIGGFIFEADNEEIEKIRLTNEK